MISEIRVVYIDDQVDEILSRYINEVYCSIRIIEDMDINKIYKEVKFESLHDYKSLLEDEIIRSANVILVDNRLFEEHSAEGKLTGKKLKVILRKLLPFVEVLIITQDESLNGYNIIHKFSGRHGEDSDDYYKKKLAPKLDAAIKNVIEFEGLADDLKQSTDVDKVLIEKIQQSMFGNDTYDALTKSDIDNLISAFKEMKENCGY